jgi:hypothetical protein
MIEIEVEMSWLWREPGQERYARAPILDPISPDLSVGAIFTLPSFSSTGSSLKSSRDKVSSLLCSQSSPKKSWTSLFRISQIPTHPLSKLRPRKRYPGELIAFLNCGCDEWCLIMQCQYGADEIILVMLMHDLQPRRWYRAVLGLSAFGI